MKVNMFNQIPRNLHKNLKKLCRAEGGANIFWVFSCEKSRFYAKKNIFCPILGGARARCVPPWIRPCIHSCLILMIIIAENFKFYHSWFVSYFIIFNMRIRNRPGLCPYRSLISTVNSFISTNYPPPLFPFSLFI